MFLRYFDSLAIFGNARLSRIRYFRSLITLRAFSVKCEIFGNHNLFFLSWSATICDLLYMLESKHRLDRTKQFGITREPVFCWVWMHAAPCHGQYFVCEIGKEEALKFIRGVLFREQADLYVREWEREPPGSMRL